MIMKFLRIGYTTKFTVTYAEHLLHQDTFLLKEKTLKMQWLGLSPGDHFYKGGIKLMGAAAFGIVFFSAALLLRVLIEKCLVGGEK